MTSSSSIHTGRADTISGGTGRARTSEMQRLLRPTGRGSPKAGGAVSTVPFRTFGELLPAYSPKLQIDSIVADRYKVRSLIGKGGMGYVYLVEDTKVSPSSVSALKIPRSRPDTEFLKAEGRLLRSFSDNQAKHVPRLIEERDSETDGFYFIAMEMVEGMTLQGIADQRKPLSEFEAFALGHAIAAGLEEIHSFGVGHFDLKPENILLRREAVLAPRNRLINPNDLVLIDFGIAGDIWCANQGLASFPNRGILGTPAYISPETLLTGTYPLSSDIYAVGLIIYELITGKNPFQGNTIGIMSAKLHSSVGKPAGISIKAWEIIGRALEKDPNKRFLTIAEMRAAIFTYLVDKHMEELF